VANEAFSGRPHPSGDASFLADRTAHTVWSAIGILLSSVRLSVCDAVHRC